MRGPREIRRWIDRLRRRARSRNGVVPAYAFDSPEHERKWAKSFKQRSRTQAKKEPA